MRLGFACICNTLLEEGKFRSLTVKKAKTMQHEELLNTIKSRTLENFNNTYKILQFCVNNNIKMYRFSSKLVVLDNHELNTWDWYNDIDIINITAKIRQLVKDNDIGVSMHPDQFTVINSPNKEVFQNSQQILEHHYKMSQLLGNNLLCIHVGGAYGDKQAATKRFIHNFNRLPKHLQDMIHIENDDKSYNVEEVLSICKQINRPMILDIHHDRCLQSSKDLKQYIDDIKATWKGKTPKCHLSSGKESETDRKHHEFIKPDDYNRALDVTRGEFDIMFEAKQKELNVFLYQ